MRLTQTSLLPLAAGFLLLIGSLRLSLAVDSSDQLVAEVNASLSAETAGDYAGAWTHMDAARKLSPNDYFVQLRCGWVQYLNQRYEEARGSYLNASEIAHGQSIEAYLGLTYPLAALEDWSGVERAYLHVLELDPRNFEASLRLGQIYLNRSDFDRADSYLKLARDQFPGSYEANLSFGWNNYWKGNAGSARECFLRALMISPGDTSATRGLGLLK